MAKKSKPEAHEYKFGPGDRNRLGWEITPLGAAIVEAMPDRKRMKEIRVAFRKRNACPVSKIFSAAQVMIFYGARGEPVVVESED